jgi:glycosyltransferase involved in cell wall biosynthesis
MASAAKPLRIVHCFRSPVGGIFRHVRDLVDAQIANGHQVGIVCDSSTGGSYEDQLFEAIQPKLALGLTRVQMQRHVGPGDITAAWRTYKAIKKLYPDVLHGHGAKGGVYSRLFGSLLRVFRSRVARLYSPHGGSLHYDNNVLSGKIFFLVEGLLARLTDRILFVADYERRTFIEKIGPPKNAVVIYNGLRPAEFEPVLPAADAADFLYIGMMRDLKGADLFIDALASASNSTGRELSAVMVGAGDDLPKYSEQVQRLGLEARVSFHDPMPARQAFAMARTIVVPSRAEAMPYIVLEAVAAGMTMIATRVGGIPEILGIDSPALCDVSAEAISAKMIQRIRDPQVLANAMPSADLLKTKFGVDVMARQIESQYRAILEA